MSRKKGLYLVCFICLPMMLVGLARAEVTPATVVSTMRVTEDTDTSEHGALLAGFFRENAAEPALSVVWRQDYRSWFPSWELVLEVTPDLARSLQDGTRPQRQGLGVVGPEAGHVYETSLSYDPQSGLVSAAVIDLTSGTRIYADSTQLQAPLGPLRASGGRELGATGQSAFLTFAPPIVTETFVPVGTEWDVLVWDTRTQTATQTFGRRTTSLPIDRRLQREIAVRLAHPLPSVAGHYRVAVDDGTRAREMATTSTAADPRILTMATADFPVGTVKLALEYVDRESRSWYIDSRPLRVGVLELGVAPIEVNDDQWVGKLTLSGDGAFPGFTLGLGVTISPVFDFRSSAKDQVLQAQVLESTLGPSLEKPLTLTFSVPRPSSDHQRWQLKYEPTLAKEVGLLFSGKEETVLLSGKGRKTPPGIDVEAEEVVYHYTSSGNGAGPMWCHGSTSLLRYGDQVFAAGLETILDAKPLNNCLPLLFRRGESGWELIYRGTERTREPSPIAGFDDGRVFLSVNPTLTAPNTYNGPSEPRILEFDANSPGAGFETHLPGWAGTPAFTEHSYRSFAADATNHELIIFQNVGRSHSEWAFYDREGAWSAQGQLSWPWGKEYDPPLPVRICYPTVALKDRAVYFFGISDIAETNPAWHERKKQMTGQDTDWVLRRLFFTWSDDIRTGQFHQWIEIASREDTAGWLRPCDLSVDADGNVHLLWLERALDERLQSEFFPLEKQSHTLNYAIVRDGVVLLRRVLHFADGNDSAQIPSEARFHIAPSGRLYAFYLVGQGANLSNKIIEVFADGTASPPYDVPLQKPIVGFAATPRAGSLPSEYLDILGAADHTVRYARIRIADTAP